MARNLTVGSTKILNKYISISKNKKICSNESTGVAHMIGMTHNRQTGNASVAIERQNVFFDPNNNPDAHEKPMTIGVNTPTSISLASIRIH
tara:strand:- start:7651 stop:7923 length:273 start_codon:yes stop_codon:yes gene_type:complete